ncbi:hypothetical protein [Pyxidicoccus xibeiensis]|uniref:hypothetical protein n=1 Tax=Pyxidicoccus xibeiensis TaxID=2906759 RepID=UPI0020A7AF02|nr:hypothetical protein [Pyxidicoccus xibeiensis]MCP3137037.1 hypothetical protein [Pyxidicoccus xibeiensis]
MTTWSATAFSRGLAALRAFTESEPELAARARADFPESWDAEEFPWMDLSLMAWLLHGREDAEGRTAADRRLLEDSRDLPRAERSLMSALASSWCSVFEVEDIRPGTGLRLRDLLLDEVLDVKERRLTAQVEEGDTVVLWVMPVEDHLELVGSAVLVPVLLQEPLVVAARRQLLHLEPAETLSDPHRRVRRLAPFLFRHLMELFTTRLPPPIPFVAPRPRAFLDAAGKRPRKSSRKEVPLEPGSAYVFKLGPIDTLEDSRTSFYVALTAEGDLLPPVMNRKDAEALAALAPGMEGHKRYCESRLARAGAALGYSARPMPADIAKLRAVLAVKLSWGPEARAELDPELVVALLEASAELIRAAPWETWTNEEVFPTSLEGTVQGTRELSVLGNGLSEFGFALFDRPGSTERLALSAPSRQQGLEVLVPDSMGLTLEDEPSWAVKAVQQPFGIAFVPELLRVQGNTTRLGDARDMLVAAAVARALASARPEEPGARAELRVGALHVSVRLEVPLPLLTGEYVGRAMLEPLSAPRPRKSPGPRRPLREVPRRKVSETLLDFAQPLLTDVHDSDDPEAELFVILSLAMSAWNAVVQDTWEPRKGWVERARTSLRRLPKGDREEMTRDFELLVERKHRHFADDPRLLDSLEVGVSKKGDVSVRLMGMVTPGARAEFLGV